MLQVCVQRLRERWPRARIAVVTEAPALLERHCPGTVPVPAAGRYAWLRQPRATGSPTPERRLARRLPIPAARALLRVEARRRGRRGSELATFVGELLAADLFLLSGRGGLTDAFADESVAVLEELALATAAGVPTALLGQGIGPLGDDLRRRAASVLPAIGLIGLREGVNAPRLLMQLGVPSARVAVTGDDAIELALAGTADTHGSLTPPAGEQRRALAVSLRVAGYADIGMTQATVVAVAVRAVAARLAAPIEPIAMSQHPHEDDAGALAALADGEMAVLADAAAAIARIGRARVIVTGSYHAAVFALAQGIPAVCVTASPYYDWKLAGLRGQFGDGCEVVSLAEPDGEQRIATSTERLWQRAPQLAAELRLAAERQVTAGRQVYARLGATVVA
jgi:polysaccharide pyruvyl transferase WcaK-like protein